MPVHLASRLRAARPADARHRRPATPTTHRQVARPVCVPAVGAGHDRTPSPSTSAPSPTALARQRATRPTSTSAPSSAWPRDADAEPPSEDATPAEDEQEQAPAPLPSTARLAAECVAALGVLTVLLSPPAALAADPAATAAWATTLLRPAFALAELAFVVRIVMTWYPGLDGGALPWALVFKPTEPLLGPTRRVVPPVGGVDVAPIIWFALASLANEILVGPQGILVLLSRKQSTMFQEKVPLTNAPAGAKLASSINDEENPYLRAAPPSAPRRTLAARAIADVRARWWLWGAALFAAALATTLVAFRGQLYDLSARGMPLLAVKGNAAEACTTMCEDAVAEAAKAVKGASAAGAAGATSPAAASPAESFEACYAKCVAQETKDVAREREEFKKEEAEIEKEEAADKAAAEAAAAKAAKPVDAAPKPAVPKPPVVAVAAAAASKPPAEAAPKPAAPKPPVVEAAKPATPVAPKP